jgi:hypothetical protein
MRAQDKLRAYWSNKENDIEFHWPGGVSTKADGHYLYSVLTDEVVKELQRRGYDPRSLKFEISPMKGNQRFTSQKPENTEASNEDSKDQ